MLNGGHNEGEENAITYNAIDVPYCVWQYFRPPPPKKNPEKKTNKLKNKNKTITLMLPHLQASVQGYHSVRKKNIHWSSGLILSCLTQFYVVISVTCFVFMSVLTF